jgi:copper(I)-binding protein
MKSITISCILTLFLGYTPTLFAEDIIISIEEARVNATTGDATHSFAYMQIINFTENKSIELVSASSTAAKNVSLQKMPSDTLIIEPQSAAYLDSDSYYIQLDEITSPIQEGSSIPLVLNFSHGESYLVDAIAVKPGTHLHTDGEGNRQSHLDH